MGSQRGFTLIELMVVIVIIGILSALAIPKMFGLSAKAKVAEAPGVLASYETLESAYAQETGAAGDTTQIGFKSPNGSKWWNYHMVGGPTNMTATIVGAALDGCSGDGFVTDFTLVGDTYTHSGQAACRSKAPNF